MAEDGSLSRLLCVRNHFSYDVKTKQTSGKVTDAKLPIIYYSVGYFIFAER
jgi:hypothetical protein